MEFVWQALTNMRGIKTNPTLSACSAATHISLDLVFTLPHSEVQAAEFFALLLFFLSSIPFLL